MKSLIALIGRGLLAAPFVFLPGGLATALDFFEPVTPPRAFQVMVHRGMAAQAPENSRPAIELAIEDGFEWVEVDVRLTKDGHHVLIHDETLDRTTDGLEPVAEMTLAEIKKLDAGSSFAGRYAGERILSLPECLTFCKGKINLCLDLKAMDAERLVREIQESGMTSQVVVFGSPESLEKIRRISNGTIALMTKWEPALGLEDWLDRIRPAAVEIDAENISREVCATFHSRGIKVQAKVMGEWDKPEGWARCLDAGVDWVQTDLPEELAAHAYFRETPEPPIRYSLHRGAGRYAPENTFPAFEKSVALHADYIEVDVRVSSDGVPFLLHDGKLDRTTDGTGPLGEKPAEMLKSLDAGKWFARAFENSRIPTFEEFLEWLPEEMGHYCDAKDIPPLQLADLLKKHDVVDRTVVYQGVEYLKELTSINSEIRALAPLSDPADLDGYGTGWKPYAFDTSWEILSKDLIARCHSMGIQVYSDGFGEDATSEKYKAAIEWGIDVIQTDDPMILLDAMRQTAAN